MSAILKLFLSRMFPGVQHRREQEKQVTKNFTTVNEIKYASDYN